MAELMDNAGAALEVPRLSVHQVCEPEEQDSFFSDPETFGLPTTLSCLGIDWNLLDISEFETYEPLGILVELARTGKIDPWDIDIVQLTDNFLGRVEELQKMDLRISSRTLLYSAILLRMKSSGILDVERKRSIRLSLIFSMNWIFLNLMNFLFRSFLSAEFPQGLSHSMN